MLSKTAISYGGKSDDSGKTREDDDYIDYVELRKGTLPTPKGYASPFTPIQEKLAGIREVPYKEVYWLCKEFGVERDNLPKGGPESFLERQFHPLYYICCRLLQINYNAMVEVANKENQLKERGFDKGKSIGLTHDLTKDTLDKQVEESRQDFHLSFSTQAEAEELFKRANLSLLKLLHNLFDDCPGGRKQALRSGKDISIEIFLKDDFTLNGKFRLHETQKRIAIQCEYIVHLLNRTLTGKESPTAASPVIPENEIDDGDCKPPAKKTKRQH